jgi:HSP20 family protein
MALVRTRPIRTWGLDPEPLDSIDRLFERLTGPAYATAADAVNAYPFDLYETDDAIVLEMAVPGVDADDIDLSIEGRQLSIRATVPEAGGEDRRYWTQTIPRGDVGRTVKLPVGVDADAVSARVRDGLLTLTMPKVHEAKVKKIAIDRA